MGIMMKMGIVKLPQYRSYWSQQLRYPPIADMLPRNRFQQLVENLQTDKSDKLAKIRPVIIAVRNQCIKAEPEEYHSVRRTNYSIENEVFCHSSIQSQEA
jgi:hypothetical protein